MNDTSRLVRMQIKNIGCIGGDGLMVELDEIVCLVGANNAGKTTVLRAYELAVRQQELKIDEINRLAGDSPASVELWIHIPNAAANIDEKWKEAKDGLLLVRSKWEWPPTGGKPVRSTWDPSLGSYAEDGKAAGLDAVFNSRLPQPFRIGSLEDPAEEHKRLLSLVLEPVANRFKILMRDEQSELRKKIEQLPTCQLRTARILKRYLRLGSKTKVLLKTRLSLTRPVSPFLGHICSKWQSVNGG